MGEVAGWVVRLAKAEAVGSKFRVSAAVEDAAGRKVKPRVALQVDAMGYTQVDATCSCAVKFNCKHALAAILAAQREVNPGALPSGVAAAGGREAEGEGWIEPEGWFCDFEETRRPDWFEFDYGVQVGGERVSLLPVLIEFLRSQKDGSMLGRLQKMRAGEKIGIPLGVFGTLAFPAERMRAVLTMLAELFDPEALTVSNRLPVHRARAAELEDLADPPAGIAPAQRRAPRGPRLHAWRREPGGEGVPLPQVAEPVGFQGTLRSYQREGVAWMQWLRENDLSGVLADDMGLGKTVQTICHLFLEKSSGRADLPSLIVAPTSLLSNWKREAKTFAPDLRVLVYSGGARHRDAADFYEYDVIVTSYPVLIRDAPHFGEHSFHCAILDEAQAIKNPRARCAKVCGKLHARHRVALSGTPMENHLGELWSLFHFLMPGYLGTQESFDRTFRTPIEKGGDESRAGELARRVAPLMIRRTKAGVATELPPKTEIIRTVPLADDQAELYEAIRAAVNNEVCDEIDRLGIERSQIVILEALNRLRQVCCDPRLLKMESAAKVRGSAKLEHLTEMLEGLLPTSRGILIFSQFTSMLDLISGALSRMGVRHLMLTGQTRDRGELVKRFQAGEAPVFLISLRAGGTGLTLTRADTVIHYDPWWNPALESQASDRAYRIGQDRPVFVFKLIAEMTIEEKIVLLQQHKKRLVAALMPDSTGGGAGSLSKADVDLLLSPVEGG
ncbi:MAG: DEAD/DEAH box helicase [Verrucomicrobiales bacterium]